MRKTASRLLARCRLACMLLALSACGGSGETPDATAANVAAAPVRETAAATQLRPLAAAAPSALAAPTGNGLYALATTSRFPAASTQSTNYWVDVVFSVTPTAAGVSIWPATAVPGYPSNTGDRRSVNLGVRFSADVAGYIRGIRFYKGVANTGVHVGTLWDSAGNALASATFTGESATGWQQVNFPTPVPIAAGTVYVASYLAPQGGYAADRAYFAAAGVDNGPLHALKDGAAGPAPTAIVPLYDASTVLEPEPVTDTGTAIVTRIGDRARDRHAREASFHLYDHYLSWYWEQRTATIEIIDKVAKGGTEVVFNIYPLAELSAPEFRAFFRGITTPGEYWTNISMKRVGTLPYHYTTTLTFNAKMNRAIRTGDRMELEVSQFLRGQLHGRANYYGTALLYVVGQGGVVPWEGQGAQLDSFPLAPAAWTGGRTTLPYQYSNEPLERFKQTAGQLSAASAQPFMLGRRLHHTDFKTGVHSEFPTENPVYTQQVGKLGPQFYAPSCVACHLNNGRAIPPATGTVLTTAVTRVGTATGAPDAQLGSSLQPLRTDGAGEGSISIGGYTVTTGSYGDGTPYELRRPTYNFVGRTPTNFSVRNTPPLVGLGLLEALPESTVLALADPDDANGDGISGRAQRVTDPQTGQARLGRFGWKAGQARLSHQIASALNADMGVMTSIFPSPDCGSAQTGCGSAGAELADADLAQMVRYVSLLGVAARRSLADAQALQGEALFASAGCAACHVATLTTSAHHPQAELRSQVIHPYTDLLLHDMGPGLADNLGELGASGAEWRTPPLWSIGLTAGVAGGAEAYLHDGRARTLSEAILWHGGEAETAKEAFRNMAASARAALLKFLQSL